MRGKWAIAVGVAVILGTAAAATAAGLFDGSCCICRCFPALDLHLAVPQGPQPELEFAACLQVSELRSDPVAFCDAICGDREFDLECSREPVSCAAFSPQCAVTAAAPSLSPYGIAGLLVVLGGVGVYQIRKRVAARAPDAA